MSGFDWNGNGRVDAGDWYIDYEIMNDKGEEVQRGEIGELMIYTDAIIKEYYKKSVMSLLSEIKLMEKMKSASHIVGIEDYEVVENENDSDENSLNEEDVEITDTEEVES